MKSSLPFFDDSARVLRRLWSQMVDEGVGVALLHACFRHGRHVPFQGQMQRSFPDLHSGDLHRFYQPIEDNVDLWLNCEEAGRTNSCTIEDFRFTSPVESPFPENNLVWGRRWRSNREEGKLTVVGVDGIVQFGSGWFRRLADNLTPVGIDVVMMDAPYNHRRTPEGYRPGQLIVGGDLNHQLAVSRQGVLDLCSVILSLRREGRRVGLVGVSYGGWMSLIASLLIADLEYVISLAPPVDMLRLLDEGGAVVRAIRRGLGYGSLDWERIEKIVRPLVPCYWEPRLPGEKIILHAARYDRFVPVHRFVELAERWNTQLVFHEDGHIGATIKKGMIEKIAGQIRGIWLD